MKCTREWRWRTLQQAGQTVLLLEVLLRCGRPARRLCQLLSLTHILSLIHILSLTHSRTRREEDDLDLLVGSLSACVALVENRSAEGRLYRPSLLDLERPSQSGCMCVCACVLVYVCVCVSIIGDP